MVDNVEMVCETELPPKIGSRDKTQPSENDLSLGRQINDQQHFEKAVDIATDEAMQEAKI